MITWMNEEGKSVFRSKLSWPKRIWKTEFLCGSNITNLEVSMPNGSQEFLRALTVDPPLMWGPHPQRCPEDKLSLHHLPSVSFPNRPSPLWAGPSLVDWGGVGVGGSGSVFQIPCNILSPKGHDNEQRWSSLHCDDYAPPVSPALSSSCHIQGQ